MAKKEKKVKNQKIVKEKKLIESQEEDIIILDANESRQQPTQEPQQVQEPQTKSLGNFNKKETKEEQKEEIESNKENFDSIRPKDIYKNDEEPEAMGDRLQLEADNFKEKLKDISSVEELEEMEKDTVSKIEELEGYFKVVEYDLPRSAVFDGKTVTHQQICKNISKYLQRKEINFSYTLGLYQLVKFWNTIPSKVNYYFLNSTLETLSSLQFKGFQDWVEILSINEYFKLCNDEYKKDITAYQYLSTIHSHIVERIQLVNPNSTRSDN